MLPQQRGGTCDTASMEQHVVAYIGLGANMGAPRETLARAVSALALLPGSALAGVSRLYRTRPVGPVEQGHFLNAVVALRVPAGASAAAGAMALIVALKDLERTMGRVQRERWGPREIDLDLLLFGQAQVHVERDPAAYSVDPATAGVQWLDVPHVAADQRSFVLAPLADLDPGLEPPGWGQSVAEALARALAAEGPDAVEPLAEWDQRAGAWRDLD
jgi:2-amino-4-hydroxy-6-hydroxymethyldihydropteridine diphosphokinase